MFRKALAGLARLFSGGGGGGVATGTATGKVFVGDRSFELRHAYAYAAAGDEELWLYLTDAPLRDKQVTKRFGVHDAARAGEVHGVKLTLDPADRDPRSLNAVLLMPPANANESLASISASGTASRFERLSLPPETLAGRIRYEREAIFDSPPHGFEAEFDFAAPPPA
jgi:hypothetical protein